MSLMEVSVVSRVRIHARPEDIFYYLSNLRFHFLWNPSLRNIKPMTKLQQGLNYQTESVILGVEVNGNNQVTKFKPNRELQIENNTGSIHYTVNYHLASDAKGVVLTCSTQVKPQRTAFKFTIPVLKTLARRELQSDLQALKVAVEQRLADA